MKLSIARGIDWYLVFCTVLLLTIGLSIIYSLTIVRGSTSLVMSQVVAAGVGLIIATLISFYDYRKFRSKTFLFYFVVILLLIAVLFWGDKVLGAKRWISLGGYQLQPSELMKLSLLAVVSNVFSQVAEFKFKTVLLILFLVAAPVTIVMLQPDLGTASVLFLSILLILFGAKLPKRYWLMLTLIGLLVSPIVYLNLKDYQQERVKTFFSPTHDPYGSGYNVLQSTIAVGNGGLLGQGIGQGTQSQLEFLPVAHTDFIFAGIAEATGLTGSVFVIFLLATLCVRALLIAQRSNDRFGTYLAQGIAGLWLVQFSINIAMNLGMVPVTGIPLPFVSHGGTALVVNFAALGLLQSIAIRTQMLSKRTI